MPESFDASRVVTDESLEVTVSEVAPDTILCAVAGEVDLFTAPTLREKLADATAGAPSHLVIDLSAVHFLASIGLSILVETLTAQEGASRHLAIVIDNNHAVLHSLETTGLDQVFDLHTAVESAVKACAGRAFDM